MPYMMTDANTGIVPREWSDRLIVQPVTRLSVAMQVSTRIGTDANSLHLPRLTSDVSAAWTAEGATIAKSQAGTDGYVAVPRKLAALATLSNELVRDSSPEAMALVGDSTARVMAKELDTAWFGDLSAPAFAGLGSLEDVVELELDGPISDADAFVDAALLLEENGAHLTSYIASPATVRAISKLKQAAGSNVPLVNPDVTVASGRTLNGRPLYSTPALENDVIYGIAAADVFTVFRNDIELATSSGGDTFAADSTDIRGVMRVTGAYPREASIIRIFNSDEEGDLVTATVGSSV